MRFLQWKIARALYAFDALVLDYRSKRFTKLVHAVWPDGYSRECPPWAM
jgi:hypothetical protein